ncbi:unnamed protein product [Bemisia tabaci]|uniref:Small ribosomal subunit protein bS16m n=1 Tax=Bemisia tabaci TaxID=7038 RepID=A0A9P0AIN7_BEMTA|nr:unnamed protein product [Bemisia tabaci]
MVRKWVNKLLPAAGGGVNIPTIQKSIRLALKGCTNRPFFHINVHTKTDRMKQQPIEQLGSYDPMPNMFNEKLVSINYDRVKHWIADGGRTSRPAAELFGLAGFFPVHPRTYMTAWRRRKSLIKLYEQSLKAKETQPEEKEEKS